MKFKGGDRPIQRSSVGPNAVRAQHLFATGYALHQRGDLAGAQRHYQAVIAVQPVHFDALHMLGMIAYQAGLPARAVDLLERALGVNPSHAEVHSTRGLALMSLGQQHEALASFDKSISLKPRRAESHYNRGVCLQAMLRFEDALAAYDKAIKISPVLAEAHANRGNVLRAIDKLPDALASHRRAIKMRPEVAENYYNEGLVLFDLDETQYAIDSYNRAIARKPDYAQAYTNRGIALQQLKRYDEATASFDEAIRLNPGLAEARLYRGISDLACGNYASGWEGFEWRWRTSDWNAPPPGIERPIWQGKPSSNRLLIRGEQGIGDQILFASFLPDLQRFAHEKTVAVERKLLPLFERSFPHFRFVSSTVLPIAGEYDEEILIGSLGQHFRPSDDAFPDATAPYLKADRLRTESIRHRVSRSNHIVCGISWNSKNARIGKAKSVLLQELLPILRLPNFSFVDLQYGDTAAEREAIKCSHDITVEKVEEIDSFDDIDGLAALISACDIVVTVSNTTAHLAGALGKRVLLLLSTTQGRLWYWRNAQGRSIWYPTVRVFEQATSGAWSGPVDEVAGHILSTGVDTHPT